MPVAVTGSLPSFAVIEIFSAFFRLSHPGVCFLFRILPMSNPTDYPSVLNGFAQDYSLDRPALSFVA